MFNDHLPLPPPGAPYDDGTFEEWFAVRSPMFENCYIFAVRHKESRMVYEVVAADRAELAAKIAAGDWHTEPPRDEDDDEEE